MKYIQLTKGKRALIDEVDFERVNKYSWRALRRGNRWYAGASGFIDGKWRYFYLHRFILNPRAGISVDHKDRNGLNNRRNNLRTATQSQNLANTPKTRGVYRYKGVRWLPYKGYRKRWQARLMKNYKTVFCRNYHTAREAALAYDKAVRKHYGEFAVTNF